MEVHKLFITACINALACHPSLASIISCGHVSADCTLARLTVRMGAGCTGWSIGPAPWPWLAFIWALPFSTWLSDDSVSGDAHNVFFPLVVLHHIYVCTKFWLSPWYSNKVLMLQPLSLAAPPVSASLLFKDGIPAEPARTAAHPLRVHQALCYPPRNRPVSQVFD